MLLTWKDNYCRPLSFSHNGQGISGRPPRMPSTENRVEAPPMAATVETDMSALERPFFFSFPGLKGSQQVSLAHPRYLMPSSLS